MGEDIIMSDIDKALILNEEFGARGNGYKSDKVILKGTGKMRYQYTLYRVKDDGINFPAVRLVRI